MRTAIVDPSVASVAERAAAASIRKSAAKFSALGIATTSVDGTPRPLADVAREARNILAQKFPNQAARAAKMTELFGRFGYTAVKTLP